MMLRPDLAITAEMLEEAARLAPLERVDIHRVQMNALMMDSMDRNARGVWS